MKIILERDTSASLVALFVNDLKYSTIEEQLHYNISPEDETLVIDIRKGDFNKGLLKEYSMIIDKVKE